MRLAEGFGPYHQAAAAAYTSVSTLPHERSISTCPAYLDDGAGCAVLVLDADHVIKIPPSEWSLAHFDPQNLEPWALEDRAGLARRVEALDRAIGATGLEQMVAYDLTTMPSVITRRLYPVDYTSQGSEHHFTVPDYHSLCAGLESLQDRKLSSDPSPSNFLYETGKGFTIIDYHVPDGTPRSLQDELVDFAQPENFDAYHHHDNARAYHQAITERYGPSLADPVAQLWQAEGIFL